MDAVFTVAELTMLSETVNSIGVEPDAGLTERLPPTCRTASVPRETGRAVDRKAASHRAARAGGLDAGSAQRCSTRRTRDARRRRLQDAWRSIRGCTRRASVLSEYIRTQATLDPRTRELLIMRIGALCRSDYEWAAHAPAGRRAGMTEDVRHLDAGPIAAARHSTTRSCAPTLISDQALDRRGATRDTVRRHCSTLISRVHWVDGLHLRCS